MTTSLDPNFRRIALFFQGEEAKIEKKLIRWKAVEEKLKPKGKLWFYISDFALGEKETALRELKEDFNNNPKVEEANKNSIKGFVECYHDETIDNLDKMLQNGWKW